MNIVDHMVISVETSMIDSVFSLKKNFIELIYMNPWMVLY